MAMIDYGAILKKDGVFINKNAGLFMNTDGMNIPEKVVNVALADFFKGEYFVYIGANEDDENGLWIGFYKTQFKVAYDKKIIYEAWLRDDNEKLNPLLGHKGIVIEDVASDSDYPESVSVFIRRLDPENDKPSRFVAALKLSGHFYDVIFGYGIDPREDVWNEIKFNTYGFTEIEREIIDRWF